MNHMRHPGSIHAALGLIQCCLHNGEYEDAEHYARHAMFMINDMADNFIPSDQRPQFLAGGSRLLALAIYWLAKTGGIPPEDKQKAGEEAIVLARQALEIHTQLHGAENIDGAHNMDVLADVLDYFNDVDDDETLRLREQSIAIIIRVEGSSSLNAAVGEQNLGRAYKRRANRALAANDVDRLVANLELSLTHHREAVRIYRAINRADDADKNQRAVDQVEDEMRQIRTAITAAAASAARG